MICYVTVQKIWSRVESGSDDPDNPSHLHDIAMSDHDVNHVIGQIQGFYIKLCLRIS